MELRPAQAVTQSVARAALLPPQVIPETLSTNSRFLVLMSAARPLDPKDTQPAPALWRHDLQTHSTLPISVSASGRRAAELSLSPSISGDGSRVAFQCRSSSLVAGDTNQSWDVFVRDLEANSTRLVSIPMSATGAGGASTDPRISPDGRRVLFESTARNVASGPLTRPALLIHNLETSNTIALFNNVSASRSASAGLLSADGLHVVGRIGVTAINTVLPTLAHARSTDGIGWNGSIVVPVPDDLVTGDSYDLGPHALADDASGIAFLRLRRQGSTGSWSNEVVIHDLETHTNLTILQGTNAWPSDLDLLKCPALFSADGRYLVCPLPVVPPGSSNPVVAWYQWDAVTQNAALVTHVAQGASPASGHAWSPQLSADGRFLLYLSEAANLTTETTTAARRLYAWDRETGSNRFLRAIPPGIDVPTVLLDRHAPRAVGLSPGADGVPTLQVFDLLTGAVEESALPLARTNSLTAWGPTQLSPAGLSTNGTRLATLAPVEPSGHLDVQLIDTTTGARRSMSEMLARPAVANAGPPAISADGHRIAFTSTATNLMPLDVASTRDVFVFDVTTGGLLTTTPDSRTAPELTVNMALSPDGNLLAIERLSASSPVRLVDLDTGREQPVQLPPLTASPRFTANGRRLVALVSTNSGTRAFVLDVDAALTQAANQVVFRSTNETLAVALSATGNRAVLRQQGPSPQSHTLHVVDLGTGTVIASRSIAASGRHLSINANGTVVAYENTPNTTYSQILRWPVGSTLASTVSLSTNAFIVGGGNSRFPAISPDGRLVAFATRAADLFPNDDNQSMDVVVRDVQSETTLLLSRRADGRAATGPSTTPCFSADGRSIFFLSHATDLAEDDFNGSADVFMVHLIGLEEGLLAGVTRDPVTGKTTVFWNGVPGRAYRVEARNEAASGAWFAVSTNITEGFFSEQDTPVPHDFFRVVQLP